MIRFPNNNPGLMRNVRNLSLILVVGLLASCASLQQPFPKAVYLFNGRDLSNWNAVLAEPNVAKKDVWTVRDGMIICKGEPLGFIETEESFTDFKLLVEWRWAPGKKPGNSGVFLRINGQRRPLPRCIECQLKYGDAGDVYGFHGMNIDGDPARRIEAKGHPLGGDFVGIKKMFHNENPVGQWNRLEATLVGSNLTIAVNNRVVNRATDCERVPGPIGLQSEGGEIHFRKVRLTPLNP